MTKKLAVLLAIAAGAAAGLWLLWYFVGRIAPVYRSHATGVRALTTYRPQYIGIPGGVVPINGGGAFFFAYGTSSSRDGSEVRAGIVTGEDRFREFGIPTRDSIESVTAGSDGTVWATTVLDSTAWPPVLHGALVRFNGTRLDTVFRIPDRLGYAPALAVAPNGVWLALPDAHAVGFKPTHGPLSVTVLPIGLKPNLIAIDASGDAYAAQSERRTIVRISPKREVRTLTSSSGVGALAAGRTGDVWFSEPQSNRLAHITRANRIEEITVPGYVMSDAIAISRDSVWFAVFGGVGRLSLRDRTFAFVSLPDRGSWPKALAVDGSGIVWVAEDIPDGRCYSGCGGVARIAP